MTSPHLHKRKYSHFNRPVELKRILRDEGFDVLEWYDNPTSYYPPHSHPHDEYIIGLGGSMTFSVDHNDYQLEPGDALELPANTTHTAINNGATAASYLICTRTR